MYVSEYLPVYLFHFYLLIFTNEDARGKTLAAISENNEIPADVSKR